MPFVIIDCISSMPSMHFNRLSQGLASSRLDAFQLCHKDYYPRSGGIPQMAAQTPQIGMGNYTGGQVPADAQSSLLRLLQTRLCSTYKDTHIYIYIFPPGINCDEMQNPSIFVLILIFGI